MPNIMPYVILSLVILFITVFFIKYFRRGESLGVLEAALRPAALGFPKRVRPMERRDIPALLIITALYAVVGFIGLGDKDAPDSFVTYEKRGSYSQLEFKEPVTISRLFFYAGIFTEVYSPEFSRDGVNWTKLPDMEQKYGDVLRWNTCGLEIPETVRFLRIIAGGKLDLGELAIYDTEGRLVPADNILIPPGSEPLFDEQHLVPNKYSYMNSTYFDEIYHARTAYEHIRGVWPYEISHPPLGKLILSLGIRAFGLNPFGWRFMGTLFGVFMLPAMYILLKNLFGKTLIASAGTILLAADFMHFTQTRIATIDTYAVFFILLMYLFMYRFVCFDYDDPFAPRYRPYLNLFLSGLFFGLGAASKWVVLYGAAGLALLWLLFWIFRGRDEIGAGRGGIFVRRLLLNIAACVLFFIIIPCVIYYISYYPYGIGKGLDGGLGMFFKKDYFDIVVSNQKFMFTYHRDVQSSHPYASSWYMWLLDIRPILYFLDWAEPKSAFASFLNPLICWGGLIAMGAMVIRVFKYRDGRALFILLGYLSQLLPWIPISRETFAYHYFPSLLFLILALCHVFHNMATRLFQPRKNWVYAFTGLTVVLFAAFYPVISGIYVSRFYTSTFLKWLPSWPF